MLHVEEAGLSDAPSIVLLHGGGGAGWMWRRQVESLQEDFHLLIPDLPEQGLSIGAGPFTMLSAAWHVAKLIRERAHGGDAHVVGLSEGAQILVQLLATSPELVRTAIVSSALVRPISGTAWASRPAMLSFAYTTSVALPRNSDWWIRLNMRLAAGVPDAFFDDFQKSFRTLSRDAFVDLMRANQTFRLPTGLERVQGRVLVVCGRCEYEAMRRSTRDIAQAIPGAIACEVGHARRMSVAEEHNWNMNEPELFNAMVRAFIAAEPLPAALVSVGVSGLSKS